MSEISDLENLPIELLHHIFDKIPTKGWPATFITCKLFAEISKSVYVTKLITKMLSSEWLGKTRWYGILVA